MAGQGRLLQGTQFLVGQHQARALRILGEIVDACVQGHLGDLTRMAHEQEFLLQQKGAFVADHEASGPPWLSSSRNRVRTVLMRSSRGRQWWSFFRYCRVG